MLRNLLVDNKQKPTTVDERLTPIIFARVRTTQHNHPKVKTLRCLLDSGSSATIIKKKFTKNLLKYRSTPTIWKTSAGDFKTTNKVELSMVFPELHSRRIINHKTHITPLEMGYDMIIGRDLLESLGIDIKFSSNTVKWDHAEIPMKPQTGTLQNSYYIADSAHVTKEMKRLTSILDAKYAPANLNKVVKDSKHLKSKEQRQLLQLLKKHQKLFDGTLGRWKGKPYHIHLKKDAEPFAARRPYPIPKVHQAALNKEVARLCELGVLKKVNRSQWSAPSFVIPKKDGSVRFISDFRELNKRIKRFPYPIPKIQDLLLQLEGFKWATTLDLNMGYYHIELDLTSKALCTIVLPTGKYEYQKLPMGLCNSPDIFQEKMFDLFQDLEYVKAYIDDLLITSHDSFEDHLHKLDLVFQRLSKAGLKVNATKSSFGAHSVEYLGYYITREGIMPQPKKIKAIMNMAPPKTRKQLRRFIGLVNFYRDMTKKRSHLLAPMTALLSKKVHYVWTEVHQKAFDQLKRVLSQQTVLAYPNFSKPFEIHTDASDTQLGAVISQDSKPIAFYSRKLNSAQQKYTTTERELLSIVETLKEFRNILLGQKLIVHTDHKNLTYKNFNSDRVMRWRLILEEYGPEFHYIPGEKNTVADALSRLDIIPESEAISDEQLAVHYQELMATVSEEIDDDLSMPVSYENIKSHQSKDKSLHTKLQSKSTYHLKKFHGGGQSIKLICHNDKIVIPDSLKMQVLTWYHNI